jgi:hypothetical protein
VILAGGYTELLTPMPGRLPPKRFTRKEGDVIYRGAKEAHRLFLPSFNAYTLTLFTTGPVIQDWGFWFDRGGPGWEWFSHKEVIELLPEGRSIFKGKPV